ncbi:hypothetical protein LP415_10520 [Polaromonas sp. P1(28)-8]|nr:hypothetical protein LP415_10520 [Polaromonas sp. P1(28)-8]
MLIQQAPDYLAFLATPRRRKPFCNNATFIRELLYPAAMQGEINRPGQRIPSSEFASVPVPGVGESRLPAH